MSVTELAELAERCGYTLLVDPSSRRCVLAVGDGTLTVAVGPLSLGEIEAELARIASGGFRRHVAVPPDGVA